MKLFKILSVGAVIILSGCSSIAVTYDASGRVLGSCKATRGLLSTATATCHGHGNGVQVDYNAVNSATGLLETPPDASSISIR